MTNTRRHTAGTFDAWISWTTTGSVALSALIAGSAGFRRRPAVVGEWITEPQARPQCAYLLPDPVSARLSG